MQLTEKVKKDFLWAWSDLLKTCETRQKPLIFWIIINAADPGTLLRAQEVCWIAATLAVLRSLPIDEVQQVGQWSASFKYVGTKRGMTRYRRRTVI